MRVEVHDTAGALVEILDLAHRVGYEKAANKATLIHFDLPRNDPKWSAIVAFREVWLYDDLDQLVDIARIMPVVEGRNASGIKADVVCEGWATVLQDDLVAAELTFTNQTVTAILTALLAYQTVTRVTLGTIDATLNATISMRVSYENVMRACWEVRNIVGGYISVEPLAGSPLTRQLHLRADPGQDIGQRVHLGLNLRELSKRTDPAAVMTKLYPLGRGEGINQQRPSTDKLLAQAVTFALGSSERSTLTIAATHSRYKGWTAPDAALPDGTSAGDTRSRPLKVWRGAVDDTANWRQGASERQLWSTVNNYNPGAGPWTIDYVHADHLIADTEVALYGTIARPMAEKRAENSDTLVRTARAFLDTVKTPRITHEVRVADLARVYPTESFERIGLHDKVNLYDPELGVTLKDRVVSVRYSDMANPETFEIALTNGDPVPTSVQVADRLRKYESMPDGATNIWVDSFEDNVDATHPYTRRIYIPPDAVAVNKLQLSFESKPYRYYVSAAAGSSTTVGSPTTSSGGGGSVVTTVGSGGHGHTITIVSDSTGVAGAGTTDAQGVHNHGIGTYASQPTSGASGDAGSHAHNESNHWHSYDKVPTSVVNATDHQHTLTDPSHTHTVDTTHTHTITVTLTPGIVETTTPTAITLQVDTTVVAGTPTTRTDFDLTPYLARDSDGRITRGWHSIKFSPDAVGRIQGAIVEIVFVQSRGVVAG